MKDIILIFYFCSFSFSFSPNFRFIILCSRVIFSDSINIAFELNTPLEEKTANFSNLRRILFVKNQLIYSVNWLSAKKLFLSIKFLSLDIIVISFEFYKYIHKKKTKSIPMKEYSENTRIK